MDPMLVFIGLALIATAIAMGLGLLAMSGGGGTDRWLSTPLMWVRVACQGLTILFLVLATVMH